MVFFSSKWHKDVKKDSYFDKPASEDKKKEDDYKMKWEGINQQMMQDQQSRTHHR